MATLLETPSRIWRRIEDIEGRDMPSLPSLPAFDDSADVDQLSDGIVAENDSLGDVSEPIHSTPAAFSSHNTAASSIRAASSTSSTARFASSIASRSIKSSLALSGRGHSDSFDVSFISPLPADQDDESQGEELDLEESKESVPDVYLPPPEENSDGEQDLSLTEALQSISRTSSPSFGHPETQNEFTPRKNYDYSVSLRSEPKPSPFDKYRNVAMRKPLTRTRTPSLSRTTPSPLSSPTNSTPRSGRSVVQPESPVPAALVPLPRSTTASPAIIIHGPAEDDVTEELNSSGFSSRSMNETDTHITQPPFDVEHENEREAEHMLTTNPHQEQDEESQGEREPTFSSDGHPSPGVNHSPVALSSGFSSPAASTAFTPTPAYPRPHTRFDIPNPLHELANEPDAQEDDPVTPHTRRRSFLLSVINSTARPRLKFPTPHPRKNHPMTDSTPSVADLTPGPNLQTAFAGVTPRPRAMGRTSHPLAQMYVASSPAASESESGSASRSLSPAPGLGPRSGVSEPQEALAPWATPMQSHSPYDGADDRASFISTASSHDLTTHHRANTSFDPVMGLGAQGHGLGRFNAGKLNAYLHGLNRRLQEENEGLMDRLRRVEQEKAVERRLGAVGAGKRRASASGSALRDVEEDVSGEGWVEEKALLENTMATYRAEVTRCIAEKEEAEKALGLEKTERMRDKERWKERMGEVERGVEDIVKDLEKKLQEAERKAKNAEQSREEHIRQTERRIEEVLAERDDAMERVEKAERALESEKDLGGELKEANDRVGKVVGDLRNANTQMKELEEEVMRSDGRIDELEKDLREEKEMSAGLEEELNAKLDELTEERRQTAGLEQDLRKVDEELRLTKAYITELEEDASAAVEQIESLEEQLSNAQEKIRSMEVAEGQTAERMEKLEGDAERAAQLARQMEEALDAAEKKMLADDEQLAKLKGKIVSLERERERKLEKSASSNDPSGSRLAFGPTDADMEALENELDDANREIARLSTLLSQSPARKAVEKAKDAKIEMLEKEKEELMERVKALRLTATEMATPSKVINASGISPIHRQVLSMSIRAPRTPGAPLRDMSWLNNTTTDPAMSPLIAEISRLQRELDLANDSIDDKLDKLEDAGLGVIGLTKKLEDARFKIVELEDEIARLSRREDRRTHRLERVRCQKCRAKVDMRNVVRLIEEDESSGEVSHLSLPTEPPTPPTKTSEALRVNLQSVNSQLASMKQHWEEEKRQLLGEKAVLQDAANRLHVEVRNAKNEVKRVVETERTGEKTRAGIQGELDKAKRAIADLEADLASERARLRAMTMEQNRVQREKNEVLNELQRTESDIDDVKKQLHKFKQENHDLETELRANANADQKARLLEIRVAENMETIEQLRQERSLLATDHKDLQQRFSEISERANRLRDEYTESQTAHDNRRHELDLHLAEIDDLRRSLADQAEELQRAETEKNRIAAEKSDVAKTVSALESDLKRVRRDAEAFGRDLKLLRAEKERLETRQKEETSKAERVKKQSQTQIRLLNEQLEAQVEMTMKAKEDLKNHVCALDEQQLSAMKLQHNKECKGLIVQIRYLKAKFTRESSLRYDLAYQKHYLLVLLSRFEKSEQTIFASIARIGFPVLLPPPTKGARSMKSVALSIVFLLRIKSASDVWREQSASKEAVAAALQDVRRRRVAAS